MSDIDRQPDAPPEAHDDRALDLAHGITNTMRKATAAVDRVDYLLQQNDLLSGVAAHLMGMCGLTTLIIGSFELECGPRVKIHPDAVKRDTKDKRYYVEIREGKMGS